MLRASFPRGYDENKEESDLEGGFSFKEKKSVADSWPSPGTPTFVPLLGSVGSHSSSFLLPIPSN